MNRTEDADLLVDTTQVEELLQLFVKGLKALGLYQPNNPMYQRTVTSVQEGLARFWEDFPDLNLMVQAEGFEWDGCGVLREANKSDSVAWVLFKDGVRSLTLMPGAEEKEIVGFLSVIHQASNLAADAEDDLLTLLWAQDFQYIRYQFVDLGSADVPTLEKLESSEPPPQPQELQRSLKEEVDSPELPADIARIDDFDSTLYFLDHHEIEYLKGEIDSEYEQDMVGNVLNALFDILELQTYGSVREDGASIFEMFIPYLLGAGDFRSVAFILGESRALLRSVTGWSDEVCDRYAQLPIRLSEPDAMEQLLRSLDDAHVQPTDEELAELFRELQPEALETILVWLPRLTHNRTKRLLARAVSPLADANPLGVARVLRSSHPEVVLAALELAGSRKLTAVAGQVGNLLEHHDDQIRVTAAEVLGVLRTPSAMKCLELGVDSPDREVRVAAVTAIGDQRYKPAQTRLGEILVSKRIRSVDVGEKRAFFGAYASIAGPEGIATLTSVLTGSGFLRRKADSETRACAVAALGAIGTPQAKTELQKAVRDKDPVVRTAAQRALREAA